ncbi:hypothetical protein H310_12290 [Aphanomyces invadans]|uniref:Uncharacterized protein n=1 Tax=Aphanomyces invadans TaxID=157072 RepID=A0A024TII6_9STRA|nr:hypothetical protein H310_12290 [Aphanomyces invadans]ETV93955.1 hypothetical protein H310_12290 [Aphanomyces invadans]|eukprot:XP_008877515.1 hypothetical protein H310_12290 [Aphanomyces invadans]
MEVETAGRAMLCFPEDGHWFQGYFAYEARNRDDDEKHTVTLGLFGEEVPVDDCVRCCHGGYREYELTVINYETNEEAKTSVQKTGGDFCTIQLTDEARQGAPSTGAYVQFETSSMLTDENAVTSIREAFPSISSQCPNDVELRSCIVCVGEMSLGIAKDFANVFFHIPQRGDASTTTLRRQRDQ